MPHVDITATWGIKLGTQPSGAVRDPRPVEVGDLRWFRQAGHRLETPYCGRLHKRKVVGADLVQVTRVLDGHVTVRHYP